MITYLLLAYARHSARKGWTVQRIIGVLQVSLFEQKSLKAILDPPPPNIQKGDPQMRIAL